MKKSNKIEDSVKHIDITVSPELHDRVFGKLLKQIKETENQRSAESQPKIWSIIMKSRITKFAVAAVIIIGMIIGISLWGTPFDASQAYAEAMDSIKQAQTFSCRKILMSSGEQSDNSWEDLIMFKEPDLERIDQKIILDGEPFQQGFITDYGQRLELSYSSYAMTASVEDINDRFVIDDDTGMLELKQPQLRTELRDRLLKWTSEAVDDLGMVELEGQSVRLLQSQKGQNIFKIWIDPATNFPVQIEVYQTEYDQQIIYKSIQINVDLDDDLFKLEPPVGYTLKESKNRLAPPDKQMIQTKINYLAPACIRYAMEHDWQYPVDLGELVAEGFITDEVLQVVLAAPDDPYGPAIIIYQQPDMDAEPSTQLVFYAEYDQRPDLTKDDHTAILSMARGGELSHMVPYQTFEQLLKPWSDYKKLLAVNMSYLHYFCCRFAEENEQRFPQQLSEISAAEITSEKMVTFLQTAAPLESYDEPLGPITHRFRPPSSDADPASEIILYEEFDTWPDEGGVVFYMDGHSELIIDQQRFEELIK